ncbi:Protein CBG25782 [Caenorhabditis briggsae]|uniref:Uncharacterized protein n=2 Tax=Caenorhabditis briggsae TaxID=6238 RepID=A0AAE9EGZ0_CAEBR|nr:Protein CBG25782 [Caenorhabditis briggsae]ULU08782.1 hypothetical protein L3Y34_019771 [Caenorhabditis briggsae]UMM20674.1 hypothetical protein L5515_015860 [Caenorhabditis briggsae]CAR99035.1 Protein CBG25782 [Caenorhabditis briggsae]
MKTYKQLNPIGWEVILENMDTNFRIKLNKHPKLAAVNKRVPLHINKLELFSRGFIVDGTNYSVFDVVYGKVCFAINYKTVEQTERKEEMEKYNAFLISKLLAGKVNVMRCVLYPMDFLPASGPIFTIQELIFQGYKGSKETLVPFQALVSQESLPLSKILVN